MIRLFSFIIDVSNTNFSDKASIIQRNISALMSSKSRKLLAQDRFVPLRSNQNVDRSMYSPFQAKLNSPYLEYQGHVLKNLGIQPRVLFWNQNKESNIPDPLDKLSTKTGSNASTQGSLFESHCQANHQRRIKNLKNSPQKVLDAPMLRDDFYLNILDWSHHDDSRIAVALDTQVYLYTTTQLIQLCKTQFGSYASCIKFHPFSSAIMAVANSRGSIQLFDLHQLKAIRNLGIHDNRVSSIDFINHLGTNTTMLSGSKDKSIILSDLRIQNPVVRKFSNAHDGQICSIKTKNQLDPVFATGSNDNTVKIWDLRNQNSELWSLQGHQAAVKGMAWCPWKNGYLATGSGTGDRQIKLWNALQGKLISTRKTNGQISGLEWNKKTQTLISGHGYPNNQICLWSLNQRMHFKKEGCLKGHRARILSIVSSADGQTVCSASADETLKFWRIHHQQKQGENQYALKNKSYKKYQFTKPRHSVMNRVL